MRQLRSFLRSSQDGLLRSSQSRFPRRNFDAERPQLIEDSSFHRQQFAVRGDCATHYFGVFRFRKLRPQNYSINTGSFEDILAILISTEPVLKTCKPRLWFCREKAVPPLRETGIFRFFASAEVCQLFSISQRRWPSGMIFGRPNTFYASVN